MLTCWFCNNKLRKVRDWKQKLGNGFSASGTVYRCDKETCDSQKQCGGYFYTNRGYRGLTWGQPEA